MSAICEGYVTGGGKGLLRIYILNGKPLSMGTAVFAFNEYRGFGKTVSVFIKHRVNRLQFAFCQSRKVKNSYRACQVVIA